MQLYIDMKRGRVCASNNTLTGEAQIPQVQELMMAISRIVIVIANSYT